MYPVLPVAPIGMVWFGNRITADPNEIDYFDDGDITNYTDAGTTSWEASTTQVQAGSHSLHHPGGQASDERITRDAGGTLVEDGDTFRVYFYLDTTDDANIGCAYDFAFQDANNRYVCDFQGSNGRIIFRRFSDLEGNSSLGNITPAGGLPLQQWAYMNIDFHESVSTDWTVELFDSDDNSLGSNTATGEDEFSAGGHSFNAFSSLAADVYFDQIGYI